MPAYRIFLISEDDYIAGPPAFSLCQSDEEAVSKAEQLKNNLDIEVWEGDRLVACVEPEPRRRHAGRNAARAARSDLKSQPSQFAPPRLDDAAV
jgi:hypothetical protein